MECSTNETIVAILAKKVSDDVGNATAETYISNFIESVKKYLGLSHGYVFSIDNYNGACINVLSVQQEQASNRRDQSILDISIAELILNKENKHSVIKLNSDSEINNLDYFEGLTAIASFPLYDSEQKISGIVVFCSNKDFDEDQILIDVVASQIPRVSSELERMQIKKRLELVESEYRNLVEFTLDVIWESDLNGRITSINGSCRSVYGLNEKQMLGRCYSDFMTDAYAREFIAHLDTVASGRTIYNEQSEHLSKDNEIINVSCSIIPKYDEFDNIIGLLGSTRDISASVRAREIIKNNSELFSSILARLPVIFFRVDRNGYLIDIRGNGLNRMGVEDMDWVGKPGYGLFIGMDEKIDSALSGNTVFFENQGTYNGAPWTFYTSMFFDNWSGYGAVGFSVDITEQKNVEEQLFELLNKNRKLAQKLVEVQEDERRCLARELHDELGQSITAVKSLATALSSSAGDQYTEVRSLANSIIDLSGRLYEVVNNIMQRLRPDIIDGLNFNDAIRNCIVRSQLETVGVNCGLDIQGDINDLDEVVKITIYRIVQECLTNISKHAMASNVYVNIYRGVGDDQSGDADIYDKLQRDSKNSSSIHRDIIRISIVDDGIGMDINSVMHQRKHASRHGLQGISERVDAIGGALTIKAQPGKGVNIKAILYLNKSNLNASHKSDNAAPDIANIASDTAKSASMARY